MQTIKSKIKIDKQGFNDCPSRQELEETLQKFKLWFEYVDVTDREYWKNENDTLVIKTNADTLLNILEVLSADEFQHAKDEDGKQIARFWWD